MKRIMAVVIVCAVAFAVTGCAKKSPSEQMADDMKKAANTLNRDAKNLFK
jgi:predicted small lipoprotein YifL